MFKKKTPWVNRLVRVQHRDLDDKALEGIWTGIVGGHYHLTAVKLALTDKKLPMGDVFVHPSKVILLEELAPDSGIATAPLEDTDAA